MSILNLKTSVLSRNPNADISILNELLILVDRYNIKWVPSSKKGNGAYFIMSQLSSIKGLEKDDYKDNWATRSIKNTQSSEALAGKAFKFEGQSLADFKAIYKETYGESLGRTPSLWVGDWIHAYSYLTQGHSNAAKDFQHLGAKAIEVGSTQEIKQAESSGNQSEEVAASSSVSENILQEQIIKLAGYSSINFRFEVGVKNTFRDSDDVTYRRWDWVEQLPKVVKVYELKATTLTEDHIRTTLFDKHYLELAGDKYPGKVIEFIFTSPNGIEWAAKDYIRELMKGQDKPVVLKGVKVKVNFVDLQDISQRLVDNILNHNPIEHYYWLYNKLKGNREVVAAKTLIRLNEKIGNLYKEGKLKKRKY